MEQQQYNKLFLFLWNIANDALVQCIRKERQQEDNTALHSVAPVPLDDYDYQRLDLKDTSKQERFHAPMKTQWRQTNRRQYPRGTNLDDCRESHRGERYHGESRGQSYK
ncbi:hypothetical protein KZO61_09260 [Prevotella nigrescens]|nr:hypothetical protein [Prevotella nigrescens]